MLSISEAVSAIVQQRQFLADGVMRNVFNLSALARELLPEVKERVKKPVTSGAILMALLRLSKSMQASRVPQKTIQSFTDMTVRSGLVEYTYANSDELMKKQQQLFSQIEKMPDVVCTISHGVHETTIIVSQGIADVIQRLFATERQISSYHQLSSVSIKLDPSVVETLGAYAWLLNVLAWNGINIVEVVSTYTELVIIVRTEDIDRAFTALHGVLKR